MRRVTVLVVFFLFIAREKINAQTVNSATTPWVADTAAVYSDPDDNWAKDPSVIKYGNTYYMYYSSANPWPPEGGKGPPRIDYATSPDGLNWTYKGLAIPKGDSGTWNDERSQAPSKPIFKDGIWYMFYAGAPVGKIPMIGYSTSTDLIHWTEFKGNPVIARGKCNDPFVYLENGIYYLSYDDAGEAIWYVTSTNLIDWDTAHAVRTDAVGEGNIIFKQNGQYIRYGATGLSTNGEYYQSAYSNNMTNFTKLGKITMNIPSWATGAFGHGDIIEHGDEYWFYFQGTKTNGVIFQIGLARQKIGTTGILMAGGQSIVDASIEVQKGSAGYSIILPKTTSGHSKYSLSITNSAGRSVFKVSNATDNQMFWNTANGKYAGGLYFLRAQLPNKSILSKQVRVTR